MPSKDTVIGMVGLGYVGLPLAVALAKHYTVIGFDINKEKIARFKAGEDPTQEVGPEGIKATSMAFTDDPVQLAHATFIIVAVPTPVTPSKVPDLRPIEGAARTIGPHLQKGTIVVLESTVYPGVTEEVFGPALATISGLKMGEDFFLGYSPERMNPGDKEHTVQKIVKVVSGQDQKTLDAVARVYGTVVEAGLHRAPSIRVAEGSKVVENIQRDFNIALMNEFARIFRLEGIDIKDVLEAAATKWNFINLTPGLVGGHCLPDDPHYLAHRAQMHDYVPQLILGARRLNASMPRDVANIVSGGLNKAGKVPRQSVILVMGLTFKENVNDIRNSGARMVIEELKKLGMSVLGHDPHLDDATIKREFKVASVTLDSLPSKIDGIVCLAAHDAFSAYSLADLRARCNEHPLLFDLRRRRERKDAEDAGFIYLHL